MHIGQKWSIPVKSPTTLGTQYVSLKQYLIEQWCELPTSSAITVESYGIVGKCLTLLAIIFFKPWKPALPSSTFLFKTNMIYEVRSWVDAGCEWLYPSLSRWWPCVCTQKSLYTLPSDVFASILADVTKQSPSMKGMKTRSSHGTEMAFTWRSCATGESLSSFQPLQKWQNARCLGKCTDCNYTLLIAEDLITEYLE